MDNVLTYLHMEGTIEKYLSGSGLADLVTEAKDFAYCNGLLLRTANNPDSQDAITHAPFTLFPSPVPKSCFQKAVGIQKDFNLLMHRVAHDFLFLKECLQSVIEVDDFTRRMWHIYETVMSEGISQPLCLGMNRSDYMFDIGDSLDNSEIKLKQVEFNTMASGAGGLAVQLQKLHKFILHRTTKKDPCNFIPENKAMIGLAEAVVTAWNAYNNSNAVIVFLILPTERNIYDQRLLEYAIQRNNPSVIIVRKTLNDFTMRGKLAADKCLLIDGMEVAIVYQRSCYVPDHFHGEQDWETRLMIERSKAIKCPNINYHLAGTKKIQQVLSNPGVIERYIEDEGTISYIRSTFAGLYSLDLTEEGDMNTEFGMTSPELFVLKPQREGGGNNVFGEEIKSMLEKMKNSSERTSYILMEKINPMLLKNYSIRSGDSVQLREMTSELGIFGTLVGTSDSIILNEECGYLLRSKIAGNNEGGLIGGVGFLDSPYLV